jgi:hypothetical protein
VPNQVPDNAIGTINVRNAADASLVLKELEHAFSKIPHVSIIRNSTMTNPIKFDVIKNWIPEKVMPYGKRFHLIVLGNNLVLSTDLFLF